MIEVFYCASGNRRYAEIAIQAGFLYGARLPHTVYFPPIFVDQEWKSPDRKRYMAGLAKHRPRMATVLDLERYDQLEEVLDWAEEAAQYVETVVIIPKAHGIIAQLPRKVGQADVRLGYSVPSRYGGTEVAVEEFRGWPVHLLGGSPHRQMNLYESFEVVSVDCNYQLLKANRWCEHWVWPGQWVPDGGKTEEGAHYVSFEKSCINILEAWKSILGQ